MKVIALVIGLAGLGLAGCGGIGTAAATAAHPSPSPRAGRAAQAGGAVAGKLVQLNGATLVLAAQAGDVTVGFGTSTRVQQTGAGALSDVVAGACVTAAGQQDAGSVITAASVQVMLNMNGVCAPPAAAGSGRSPNGFGPGANVALVRGKVTSVSGASFVVQPASGSAVTVTVPTTARITRTVSASAAALAVGQCIQATGQKDAAGTVQARLLNIVPAGPTGCPTGAGAGFRGPRGQPTPAS